MSCTHLVLHIPEQSAHYIDRLMQRQEIDWTINVPSAAR